MNKSIFSFQDNKYEYREYGGYIFRMPINEDIKYLSIEKQNQYYWYLAEATFNQIAPTKSNHNLVSQWELRANNTAPRDAKFMSFSDIKKNVKASLIGYALGKIYPSGGIVENHHNNLGNPYQYIETITQTLSQTNT